MASRIQIGNLLVQAGIITVMTLERSLAMQKGSGKRLGDFLREMGIVTEEEVIEALARQCSLRTVRKFADQSFPKELLDLVPARMALEKIIFPLKQHQGMLAVATLDPFDRDTFEALAGQTGMKIHLALATRDDILAAIRKHYMVGRWAQGGKQKVLLIEPSPIVVKFLQPPLERDGYEVFVSHDGIDGLKSAYARQPDLIICDLMMPRMDSYMFMLALKTHPDTIETPVILLSAINSSEEEARACQAGFSDFIVKPAMPARLLVSIKKALTRKVTGSPAEAGSSRPPAAQVAAPRGRRNMLRTRHGGL